MLLNAAKTAIDSIYWIYTTYDVKAAIEYKYLYIIYKYKHIYENKILCK